MYSKAEGGATALELARACLAKPGQPMELLLMYSFEGDVDAHDDDLQDRLEISFKNEWSSCVAVIEKEYGPASIGTTCDRTDFVPLNGVGGVASWRIAGRRLWVAYAHEDREIPWLLMVGVL